MGSSIKEGQSIFIPFVNGESIPDSQNRPRMYKTVEQFEKNARVFHGQIPILIEYAPAEKKSREKPMTLEELRNAYEFSERVGLHVLIQFDSCKCEYEGVIDHRDDDGICAVYAAGGEWLKEKDYGKTWVAYADEPPRLDRSAWEPCDYCRERDREVYKTQDYPGLCSFEVAQDGPDEIVVNAYNHNTPLTEDICFSFSVLFCPKCGRPLTDAAWGMLEKRLEGAK